MKKILFVEHFIGVNKDSELFDSSDFEITKTAAFDAGLELLENGRLPDVILINLDKKGVFAPEVYSTIMLMKQKAQQSLFLVVTTIREPLILYKINRDLKPQMLFHTSNIITVRWRELMDKNDLYSFHYCTLVKESLNKIKKHPILMQSVNINILVYLANGLKVAQISERISLSQSTVQKRICKMLKTFDVTDYRELVYFIKNNHLL